MLVLTPALVLGASDYQWLQARHDLGVIRCFGRSLPHIIDKLLETISLRHDLCSFPDLYVKAPGDHRLFMGFVS